MGAADRRGRGGIAGRGLAAVALLAVLPLLAAGSCGGGGGGGASPPAVTITLDAVPDSLNDLLVVPPSGFTVDVGFPDPGGVVPSTLRVQLIPFDSAQPPVDLTGSWARLDPSGAVVVVPASAALADGSYVVVATVDGVGGGTGVASLPFAVRTPGLPPPLAALQWIQLDFTLDRDGDGAADFDQDLPVFGLGSGADPALDALVRDWVKSEVVARAQAYFSTPNPSALPGGDPANVLFSESPPATGPYTRVCVGGGDPTGSRLIGNIPFDPGNSTPSEVACDDVTPSGVFPRELLYYASDPDFQAVFDPLLADPVGTDPLDPLVLGPSYDPADPAQLARYQAIELGVTTLGQAIATIVAHESGHAMGLVPPGPPGGGLYGGSDGLVRTHNVMPDGTTPSENLLMNKGLSFSFGELSGAGGTPIPRLRELNHAYLRGRLVLDPRVTGIFPPPQVSGAEPTQLALSGPSIVAYTVHGSNLLATPQLRLLGPLAYTLLSPTWVDQSTTTAYIVVPQLAAGSYDLELTNPDGQQALLPGALSVVP